MSTTYYEYEVYTLPSWGKAKSIADCTLHTVITPVDHSSSYSSVQVGAHQQQQRRWQENTTNTAINSCRGTYLNCTYITTPGEPTCANICLGYKKCWASPASGTMPPAHPQQQWHHTKRNFAPRCVVCCGGSACTTWPAVRIF